jgi:tetratricopeptide (TPR) repeat protein
MLNVKQIALIGLVILLVAALFSLDIKGLVKEDKAEAAATATEQKIQVSVETISKTAKQSLNASLAKEIDELEQALKSADDAEKLSIIKQLAQKWDDVNQPAPAAFYNEKLAQAQPDYAKWLKTGDSFTAAYQATQDTLIQPTLVQKAITAYQEAQKANPESLDAKTGLGMAYVNGTPNPMQGIALLLEVVKQDPKNVKANTNLGLFSMRSGQFDKAVDRFKTVIEQQPDPEVWFYLASSYENLGQNKEAVLAYQKSKELAADPGLTKFVDQKINALKK